MWISQPQCIRPVPVGTTLGRYVLVMCQACISNTHPLSVCAGETTESVPPTCSGNASRIHIGDISPERSRYVAAMCLRYKWVIAQMFLIHWRYLAAMFPLCSWSVLGTQMTHPTCVPDITRNTHPHTHTLTNMPIQQLMRKDLQPEKCERKKWGNIRWMLLRDVE